MEWGHRKQYRYVYNKFWYWFNNDPSVGFPVGSLCTKELWALGRTQYTTLSRYQKNTILRHFLDETQAPEFVCVYAYSQWKVSKHEQVSITILDSQSVLLTYQGNWGKITSDRLQNELSDEELTEVVSAWPDVQELCQRFHAHCAEMANKIEAPLYASSVEICLKTWPKEHELRLHGHFLLGT